MTRTVRSAAIAVLTALAAVAAILAADFTAPIQAQSDDITGRIVARLLDDGRVEFGWQPAGGARTLPTKRYFPASIDHNRWLRSSPVEVGGAEIGRLNARLSEDGRIEFAFTPTDGERITPQARYFPADARVNRWLRSTEITIPASDGERATSDDGEQATATDDEQATSDDGERASSTDDEHATSDDDEHATSDDGEHATSTDGEQASSSDEEHAASADGEQATGNDDEHATNADDERATSSDGERATSSDGERATSNDGERATSNDGAFTAVSAGEQHTCGLRESGAIECWGGNNYGQSDALAGSYSAVSAGERHSCGLRESGVIECWGANDYGQSDAPPGSFRAVSADGLHTCGLRESGVIECWGYNRQGQSDTPGGSYTAASTSGWHTCVLRESGAIECWGDNDDGQSDDPEGSFTAVSAGGWHTCGLRETGAIEYWGLNDYGQSAAPPGSFRAASAGDHQHTCGLRENDGAIECWGRNDDGQSDDPEGSFTAVSAGGWHTCGLRESGAIECWGGSGAGQTDAPRMPGQLPTIRVFAADDGVTQAQLSEVRQQMAAIVRWFAARWGAVATPPGRVLVYKTEFPAMVSTEACGAGGDKTIYYRLTCPGPVVLAHEYAHVAQHHLSGGTLNLNFPKWMVEGMATWVEEVYRSQNGGFSYQRGQSARWQFARQEVRTRHALDDPSLPYDAGYSIGFVAIERLAQLAGEQAIFDFWPNLRRAPQNAQGAAEAFEATFGITLAEFYATFDAYLNGVRPSIRIAPND